MGLLFMRLRTFFVVFLEIALVEVEVDSLPREGGAADWPAWTQTAWLGVTCASIPSVPLLRSYVS